MIIDNGFISFVYSPWFWLSLTVIFSLIELLTAFSLTTIWFAAASAIMVFVSMAPLSFLAQICLFLAMSIFLLLFTRPFVIKKLKVRDTKTNIDSLVGMQTIVLKTILQTEKGDVKVNGLLWSATAENGCTIEAGEKCEIVKVEGAHLVVKKV